jgi:hypothetical protein
MTNDVNEGIGIYLESKELQAIYKERDEYLIAKYNIALHSTYISCWTKEPDMIAMWCLYSPNREGIRITTSHSKLDNLLRRLKDEGGLISTAVRHFHPSRVDLAEVAYKDFRKMREDIENKLELLAQNATLVKAQSIKKSTREKLSARSRFIKDWNSNIIFKEDPLICKDRSYLHEMEVRAIVQFDPDDEDTYSELYSYFYYDLDFFGEKYKSFFPENIFIAIDDNFIEEICFDPRCEKYKADIFKEIIGNNDFIVESGAFGPIIGAISWNM